MKPRRRRLLLDRPKGASVGPLAMTLASVTVDLGSVAGASALAVLIDSSDSTYTQAVTNPGKGLDGCYLELFATATGNVTTFSALAPNSFTTATTAPAVVTSIGLDGDGTVRVRAWPDNQIGPPVFRAGVTVHDTMPDNPTDTDAWIPATS